MACAALAIGQKTVVLSGQWSGDLAGSREFLQTLFRAAVAATHPSTCLPPLLPEPPKGRLILLAAGKAAGSMAETAEAFYLDGRRLPASRLSGVAVARHGYGRPTRVVEMIEAGHPIPDAAGLAAAEKALRLAESAGADDLVLVLMSGGASANWIAPADGVSFADKQAVTRALLRSGAVIGEINTVRKHLSRIKGGRLARHAYPARLNTIAISDVPHDDPSAIGSGPTVPDPTTLADARAIVAKYKLDLPESVMRALNEPKNESPKPGDKIFANTQFALAARPADSQRAAEAAVRAAGYDCVLLGDQVEGEAREVAAHQAKLAHELRAQGKRAVILSGGELTVTIRARAAAAPTRNMRWHSLSALPECRRLRLLPPTPTAPTAAPAIVDDPAGALLDGDTAARAKAARPRSCRLSCRQQFDRIFLRPQ